MSIIFSIGDFDYQAISERYEKDALILLGECFSKYEKIALNGKLGPNIIQEYCIYCLDSHLGRELTVVCIHRPSKALIGVSINHSYNSDGLVIPFVPSNQNTD